MTQSRDTGSTTAPARPQAAAGAHLPLFSCLGLVLLGADQLIKWLARSFLTGADTLVLVPHVLGLTLLENHGAAFGIFQGQQPALIVCALVVAAVCVLYLFFGSIRSRLMTTSLACICAGGIGNLIDRIATGQVTDMFSFLFMSFPVFNLADVAIVCGVALFFIALCKGARCS